MLMFMLTCYYHTTGAEVRTGAKTSLCWEKPPDLFVTGNKTLLFQNATAKKIMAPLFNITSTRLADSNCYLVQAAMSKESSTQPHSTKIMLTHCGTAI